MSEKKYMKFVNEIMNNYSTLKNNIESLPLPEKAKTILHDAREARNEIAHSVSKDLTGCIDTSINIDDFKKEIKALTSKIAKGDLIVSTLSSIKNNEPIPNQKNLSNYEKKIINWVLTENNM